MSVAKDLAEGEGLAWLVVAGVVAIVAYEVYENFIAPSANALTAPNATYAGDGPVGALANVANNASGGVFETFGNWLGGLAASAVGD